MQVHTSPTGTTYNYTQITRLFFCAALTMVTVRQSMFEKSFLQDALRDAVTTFETQIDTLYGWHLYTCKSFGTVLE